MSADVFSLPVEQLPCVIHDSSLWFAERPEDLERAKALCQSCPVRVACLAGALSRQERWGVWGGEILHEGTVIARKRARGRPRKTEVADQPRVQLSIASATSCAERSRASESGDCSATMSSSASASLAKSSR